MDIRKLDTFWCPIHLVLLLLIILPPSTGYIDCRISCRRCHENTEHPSVLEVYCAMCDECKQRRRERMLGRSSPGRASQGTTLFKLRGDGSTEAKSMVSQEPPAAQAAEQQLQQQDQQQSSSMIPPPPPPPMQPQPPPMESLQQLPPQHHLAPHHSTRRIHQGIQRKGYDPAILGWPSNCPTPPVCSDSSEEAVQLYETSTTTTTTTTPAPTQPPCPAIMPCRKKKTAMPCMPCMPMCPCPMYTYPQTTMLAATLAPTTPADYQYVYLGIPKNVLAS